MTVATIVSGMIVVDNNKIEFYLFYLKKKRQKQEPSSPDLIELAIS